MGGKFWRETVATILGIALLLSGIGAASAQSSVRNGYINNDATNSFQLVAPATPLPTIPSPSAGTASAISHAATPALATSLVVKATPGNLYGYNCTGITGTITAGSSYCVAYNATAAPAPGALTGALVLDVCTISASNGCSLSRIPMGANYSSGIVILLTSAATPFTYTTGTNTGFLSADYK